MTVGLNFLNFRLTDTHDQRTRKLIDMLVHLQSAQSAIDDLTIGSDVQAWDADLDALAALSSTGLIARTGAGTVAARTLTAPAAGISVSNGDGVAGNPTLALADDLSAVEGLSGTGIAVRTAANTWTNRTITGTANEITVTDGDGVAGAPTLSLPAALTFTGKTITGGDYDAVRTLDTVNGDGNPVLSVDAHVVIGGSYSSSAQLIVQGFIGVIRVRDANTAGGSSAQAQILFEGSDAVSIGSIVCNSTSANFMTLSGIGGVELNNTTVRFPNITTTASAANAFLDSGASNRIFRSTSSLRYKRDVETMADEDADQVLLIRPVTYRSTAEADDQDRRFVGFIAEEVHEIDPRLVHYREGEPDGVQYERVVVGLLSVVKRLAARVDALEAAAGAEGG